MKFLFDRHTDNIDRLNARTLLTVRVTDSLTTSVILDFDLIFILSETSKNAKKIFFGGVLVVPPPLIHNLVARYYLYYRAVLAL